MLGFSCNLLEQTNRGKLTLQSANPNDLPNIDPQVLEHPNDIAAMLAAMKFVQRLTSTEPLSQFYGELFSPNLNEDWKKFARSSYTSYYHGVGTCKMGPASDSMAVVDQNARPRRRQSVDRRRVDHAHRRPRQHQSHRHDDRRAGRRVHQGTVVKGFYRGGAENASFGWAQDARL